jgi:hypothetical protein
LLVVAAAPRMLDAEARIDFRRDVAPALTKAGCNAGACHGSFQGRGGFRLSLLGFDPVADYQTIVYALRGRRVNAAAPEYSLLLRKATAAIPHGGGQRLATGSDAYRLLRDFIAQGMTPPQLDGPRVDALTVSPRSVALKPGETAGLQVTAHWSDGVEQDVTAAALFDSRDPDASEVTPQGVVTAHKPGKSCVSVRYAGQVASVEVLTPFDHVDPHPDFQPANYIDELTLAEWKRLNVAPAPLCSDEAFLRRASLDLIGTLPTPDQVRSFLSSADPEKRRKAIDELLERPEYVDYWALRWGDLLRVHRRYVGDKGLGTVSSWLRRSIRENKPLDQMTRELLTAQGNLFASGPVGFYFTDQKPEEFAETTAQVFLGVRLQCARCHHHPLEVWGQDDYYGLAAFFTRLEVRDTGDKGRFGGMQILRPVDDEKKTMAVASPPRLLGDPSPIALEGDIRQPLADWITRADNPYFARNFANRYWAWLVGRGLVEPVDDLRGTNPASNPALLDALARDFVEHGFDVKHLLRTICNSRVYQLSAEVAPERDKDGSLFTHRIVRRLPAESLLDAINHATGFTEAFAGSPPGTRAIALPDPTVQSSFLTIFGRPARNNPCECARESSPDLLQALHLINNSELQKRIDHSKGRLARLLAENRPHPQIADELYLATFSRPPANDELAAIEELVAEAPSPNEGWQDVLWALLNSPEFAFNH